MRLFLLALPLFLSASPSESLPGEGIYNGLTGALGAVNRMKNGIAYYLPKLGSCPDMPAAKNLKDDIDDFLGFWYVQSALDHEILQGKARYMSGHAQYNYTSKILRVDVQQMADPAFTWSHMVASAKAVDESKNEFKFEASFNLPLYGPVGGTYTLIGSDFIKYAVIHGCGSFWNVMHYDIIWLLSRAQVLTPEEQKEFEELTHDVLADLPNPVDPKKFIKIRQKNTAEPDD